MRKELKELVNKYAEDVKRIMRDVIDQIEDSEDEVMGDFEKIDRECGIDEEEFNEFAEELGKIRSGVIVNHVESYQELKRGVEEIQAYLNGKEPD